MQDQDQPRPAILRDLEDFDRAVRELLDEHGHDVGAGTTIELREDPAGNGSGENRRILRVSGGTDNTPSAYNYVVSGDGPAGALEALEGELERKLALAAGAVREQADRILGGPTAVEDEPAGEDVARGDELLRANGFQAVRAKAFAALTIAEVPPEALEACIRYAEQARNRSEVRNGPTQQADAIDADLARLRAVLEFRLALRELAKRINARQELRR